MKLQRETTRRPHIGVNRRRYKAHWTTSRDFREINYQWAMAEATGEPHHLDHLYPINGKTVCGLHVPNNLQVLTREENRRKRNKLPGSLAHELWDPASEDVHHMLGG